MNAKYQQLINEIQSLQNQIDGLPKGKLICSMNGGYVKWYRHDGTNQAYLAKKDRQLAEELAIKKYLMSLLSELIHEKQAIEFYLRHHDSRLPKSVQLLDDKSSYKELLAPHFKTTSKELQEWQSAAFEQNREYPEHLIHKTLSGTTVRSKSEAMIDMALYMNKIPHRYECALHLSEITLFPDFTILHPQSGKLYYWEHFGMMDQMSYSKTVYHKLQVYTSNGIIPSIHLITTFETKESPLDSDLIEKIIQHYFL